MGPLICDPSDVKAIREGILQLIQDGTYRQSLIEAGRKNAQGYTVSIAAARYTALYEKIADIKPVLILI